MKKSKARKEGKKDSQNRFFSSKKVRNLFRHPRLDKRSLRLVPVHRVRRCGEDDCPPPAGSIGDTDSEFDEFGNASQPDEDVHNEDAEAASNICTDVAGEGPPPDACRKEKEKDDAPVGSSAREVPASDSTEQPQQQSDSTGDESQQDVEMTQRQCITLHPPYTPVFSLFSRLRNFPHSSPMSKKQGYFEPRYPPGGRGS